LTLEAKASTEAGDAPPILPAPPKDPLAVLGLKQPLPPDQLRRAIIRIAAVTR
jgi:hypothetical protein